MDPDKRRFTKINKMSKEEEAAARNIKLVRYTHPSPQNWKGKDGFEKSQSLPVQQKKKSEGRLMDMLKSRSAKFHNLTVNRSLSGGSKDSRNAVKKNQETCFLPMRTPNTVSRPNPISPSSVQKLNVDTSLIPKTNSSNNGSFTSKVKRMLEEQRPQLNSMQKQQIPNTSPKKINASTKINSSSQGKLVELPESSESPQQHQHQQQRQYSNKQHFDEQHSSEHEDGFPVKKHSVVQDQQKQEKNKDPLQRQVPKKASPEYVATESRPGSGDSQLNEDSVSSSTERTTPQVLERQDEHESIRLSLLKLFKQAEAENLDSDSASNFRIVQLLHRREGGEDELEEEREIGVSDSEEQERSLQGSIVAFEGELGPPEDPGTSRLEVVYMSDEEEKIPKHKVLPPSSGLLRPASPRRLIPAMKDPMAEKRKNDREVAIDALAKLKDRKTFNKETLIQLIEKGIANHRALEGNPNVSVTNDVCSVNNYETSHAYYYQQFDRRSKLAWISLHEPKIGVGNEPLKEIWRTELLASFMSCTIFFYPITSSNLSSQQQSSLDYQIFQLKKLLQHKFCIKLAGSLEKKVDIVVLYGQNEKVLNEILEKKQGSSFRVWSLQRALNYLQDVGIDLREWNIDENAQDREPVLDVPISEDSIQEDIDDSTEEIEKEERKEAESEKEPEIKRTGEQEKENSKEILEVGPQSEEKRSEPEKNSPKLTRNSPKKVVKSKSSRGEDKYVQKLLQQASDVLDKRDEQLKAAHNIILTLSRDIMLQEIQITSLAGQLKYSNKELSRRSELADQYRLCMAEQEVEMAQLRTKLARKKAKKNSRVTQGP